MKKSLVDTQNDSDWDEIELKVYLNHELKKYKILFFLIFLIFAYNTKLFASPKDFISELTSSTSCFVAIK